MKTKIYEFDQNNTGGSFITDDKVCHRVYIEAKDSNEAYGKAIDLGIYFDGVLQGMDCDCCGDRWYDSNELEFPLEYGKETFASVEDYAQKLADSFRWTKPDARIFYLNGEITEIFSNKD